MTTGADLRQNVEDMMNVLAPGNLNNVQVLIKPNMVGPSEPKLGHTTSPNLVRVVVLA